MKKQDTIKQTPKYTCCTPRQKFLGIVALGGLFACGLMVGVAMNNKSQSVRRLDTETVSQYNKETCEIIEDMLLSQLSPVDSMEIYSHSYNIAIYKALITDGCSANQQKYQDMISRESAIIDALKKQPEYIGEHSVDDKAPCVVIEETLTQNLWHCDNKYNVCGTNERIRNAKIYAQLSERGCPENTAKYTDMASRELEIARAVADDRFDENDTIEVVETYKRLEMKQAAQDVLNKVQKLTDPAIDFILQIQKTIEE